MLSEHVDYVLKVILVGDGDVGKEEILCHFADAAENDNPDNRLMYATLPRLGVMCGTRTVCLSGKRIRLQIWNAAGQGRFPAVLRLYSRGAHGIVLVYDITNRWSFLGLKHWIKQIDKYAPGVPRILIGNRLHLEFSRRVTEQEGLSYAHKYGMLFYEVSPLCDFNVTESLAQLSRIALQHNGIVDGLDGRHVSTLKDLCLRTIVRYVPVLYSIEHFALPSGVKQQLRNFWLQHRAEAPALLRFSPRAQPQPPKRCASRRRRYVPLLVLCAGQQPDDDAARTCAPTPPLPAPPAPAPASPLPTPSSSTPPRLRTFFPPRLFNHTPNSPLHRPRRPPSAPSPTSPSSPSSPPHAHSPLRSRQCCVS